MATAKNQQIVYSEPLWIKKGWYLTAKGERLKRFGASENELKKYRKMRYARNPKAKIGRASCWEKV